ncbi:DUF2322 family protein [Rivihabitans pingtungensis]|jgi:hypothetical protein|uniref:DUF2322 family protein n=1 Tax=Rivihabitans pingtungensis TaxID=1054498 RepID=UPI002357FA8A|nr:DUF2322 family protein [Rivihabitans pingtungensis]MCK6435908.1 DUF2322 family protein [Rivihabitans pingtungensis]
MTALPAQFRDVLATLPSVTHLAALTLRDASGASVARLENKPGQAGSLAVYHALHQQFGGIHADAARHGLALYAEHTADARARPGAHPNIDRLLAIAEQGAPALSCEFEPA